MSLTKLALVAILGLTACDSLRFKEPGLTIGAAREGDAFVFSFAECRNGRPYAPRYVEVFDMADASSTSTCRTQPTRVASPRWLYGDGRQGRSTLPCTALAVGHTYKIEAAGAGGGYLRFNIESDGAMVSLASSCNTKAK
jgi:hypothetical protein